MRRPSSASHRLEGRAIITDPFVYLDRSAKAARAVQASVDAAWRRELQQGQQGRRAASARPRRGGSARRGGARGAAKEAPHEALGCYPAPYPQTHAACR